MNVSRDCVSTNCLFIKQTARAADRERERECVRERERESVRESCHKSSAVCVTHRCRGVKCDKANNVDNAASSTRRLDCDIPCSWHSAEQKRLKVNK